MDSFVIIPIGAIVIFTVLYGLNQLLANVFKIRFPSSVLGMLINLILLCLLNVLSELHSPNKSSTKYKISSWSSYLLTNYLRLIKPPMNFTLKWINVFFLPSFIILPLSDPISFTECLKIAGVFVVGFMLLFSIDVYLILSLKWILNKYRLLNDMNTISHDKHIETETELQSMNNNENSVFTSMRDDITTIDLTSLKTTKTGPIQDSNQTIDENPFSNVPSINSINIPKVQEPEPIHPINPQSNPHIPPISTQSSNSPVSNSPVSNSPVSNSPVSNPPVSNSPNTSNTSSDATIIMNENLSQSCQTIIIFISNYIDWILYFILFIVSLPFYYVRSIHLFLPYHLGVTVIAYYIALLIPLRWPKLKKIAHPILILTGEILFIFFIGSLIFHKGELKGFLDDLKFYKTGKTYLNLFNNKTLLNNGKIDHTLSSDYTATPKWPGCGDFLSSLMDISIVSLSLPMFTHRKDFIKNFWVLVPPILISIALTFFCYPLFCYSIGISSERSIGFIGRSVTLALGTPLINSLDGSVSLMAVCTILSGICGVLIGDTLFKILRISKDDYVTRGVSLGVNCGAIATAHLLNVDPRAALMSSLSFSIFGTVMVIMSSIGAIRDLIKSWVGL